jgi:multidrug transporter EmrE-like cation transporter
VTYLATLLWLLCLSCETIGQLVFKKAVGAGIRVAESHLNDAERVPSHPKHKYTRPSAQWQIMLSNWPIWLGISCYAIEFFLYLAFLSVVPLAQGVLLSSLSIMTIMLGGRIFFAEKLSPKRVLAGTLITIGVSLVGWSG